MEFKDILYAELDSVAYIAINRPEVMNAFRGQTVEELLHASAEDSRESMKEARARAQTRLEATRARLSAQGDRLAAGARESVDCADRYVHDNPWTSVGIGAAAGVVVGMLLGRR